MITRTRLLACTMAAVLGGTAAAQTPAPPTATPPGTTAPAAVGQPFRAKQVLGSKVTITGDTTVGTVDDIVFDDSGTVEYLVVLNQGKMTTIPWQAAKFNYETQTAVVNITQQAYTAIPTYTVRQYPNFWTPAYRVETYKYFGLTPAERRQERRDRR